MKKTVQTTVWQFSKQLLFACLVLFGMVQAFAQTASSNYIVTIKATGISWSASSPLIDEDIFGDDEFYFSVNGASFYTGDDAGSPGSLNGLNSSVWTGVVPVGANLGAITPTSLTFQGYEFDVASDNDAVVLSTANVNWAAVIATDANGQFIDGTYAIPAVVFNAPGGGNYTYNLSVSVVGAAPAVGTCDVDVLPTGNGANYECLSEDAAGTSVNISGGVAPYKILGSGIYTATSNGETPFDFGVDPFGLEVPAGAFEFTVREGQPWSVIVRDASGCIVAQEGVFDLPEPSFNTPGTMCTSDPAILLFENSVFDPTADILAGEFFASVAGLTDNGDGFSAVFDPFVAGPGTHLITYTVQAQGGGGPGFGPGNYEDGCTISFEQVIYVYPSFDGYDAAGDLVVEAGINTGGTPEAEEVLQNSYCVGHAPISLGLTNFDDIAALWASLEATFDPQSSIDEVDFFITWQGLGVTDNADGTATFDPSAGGTNVLGARTIQVTVGYPSCPTDYVVTVNILPNFDATINDLATCATAGNSFDLTALFGAGTTAGGYFYTVGAGGALTAIPSGMLDEAANAGTTVTILYSNSPSLTNQSQCNADDCVNCDTATLTFSGLTVDSSFEVEGGPEICRGTSPLVDTVVDPIVTTSPISGIAGPNSQAIGANAIPKDLTTTASFGTIEPYGHINSLEIEITYTGLAGNTQGDHNGYSVTMPGGVVYTVADGDGPNGDNLFGAGEEVITWEEIQALYAAAGLDIDDVFTGTDAPDLVGTCQSNDFTFDLETNANSAAINITVTPNYVEPAGFPTAFITQTGTQLPAEAFTFDPLTGEYNLNTLFTDANGNDWDLSTYADIDVVFTTYSCSSQLPDGTLCTQSTTQAIKVLPALNADLADFSACTNDGSAIDLEQMFTAATTQGGVFTSSGGTVNGNYLTAGAGTYTITYTIGAGTGDDGCDPLPGTATLTIAEPANPAFFYPNTVCVGAIPALPATENGIAVYNNSADAISHEAFQATTVGGLFTLTNVTGSNGCTRTYSQDVLVVESPTAVSADATVCRSQAVVNLTQFIAGSTGGGTFSGTGVAGDLLVLGTLTSSTVTYTVGSNGCAATTTFTITIVEQPDADFDIIDQICEDTAINLFDYTLQDGGSFTDNGVAVANPAAYTSTEGLHTLVYTINGGSNCIDSESQNIYIIGDQTVTAEYGFLCQSTTDFTIDLSNQLVDGNNSPNGGTFTMREVPAFISEIEYTGGPTIDGRDFVEVTAPAGTNLNEYALVFYKRMGYTNDGVFNDDVNSGAVYGVIDLADLRPNQTVGATTPNGTIVDSEVTGLNGISYGSVGIKYFDANPANTDPGNDVAPLGQTFTGIADGPAAIALVYKGEATLLKDLDRRLGNDDVVQFIGYGASLTNTNAGIFSACDGPARSLVSVDINTVDAAGRSTQFTNTCWVNPNVDDSEVAYATSPAPNVTSTGAGIPAYATVGDLTSAGSLNVGLRGDTAGNEGMLPGRGHGDELYFDYIAPNGDVLHLDRLCHALFIGGQIVNTTPYENPENGDTDGDNGVEFNDNDIVEFTCETMTYTIPFGYQLLPGAPGSTQCGSNQAIFYLTILMDGEENWNNYSIQNPEGVLKDAVCDYSENNLNTYIDDVVHWISPIHRTGSFDTTAVYTFEENIKDPIITELKYKDYGYDGPAADDHCVVYNYVDDNNTPFNPADDNYTNSRFCDGIEISAPEGTELSCYSLVFYSDNNILPQTSANGAGFDVTYIAADGMPAKTLIANGRYMQLYGLIDNDETNAYPGGTIMTVPTFGLDIWNNYPYYGGANPLSQTNQYGQLNAPAEDGLYIDTNDNGVYDASDVAVAGPAGFEDYDGASFPWERGSECDKDGVGARWFPVLDIPGNGTEEIGGVGLINNCTGKLVDFISWGGELCVETKEDCSVAGPFEQLTTSQIDTVQSTLCCDLRTLQLVSASVAAELTGSDCPLSVADANGNVWVQVYNGGEYTIPGCGIYTANAEEFYEFSNSVGYYNCDLLEEAVIASPEAFTLDLADIDVSDNYIVTNHTIEVTIGSVEENYFQLYTYDIATGSCGNLNGNNGLPDNLNIIPTLLGSGNNAMDNPTDLDSHHNTNLVTTVPGMMCGVPTHDNAIISQPAVGTNGLLNSLEEPFDVNPNLITNTGSSYAYWDYNNPGVVNYLPGHNPAHNNNPWSNGIEPSPIYMGSTVDNYGYPIYNGWGDETPCFACGTDPNACIADGEYAPAMYNAGGSHTYNGSYNNNGAPVGPHQLEFAFDNGVAPLNQEGGCFVDYCTALAKTTYSVSNLTAYLYNGNDIPGYEDATIDSCRSLVMHNDNVRVRIRVSFDYEQCLPAGKFAGSDVSLNDEDEDMPYWVFEPQGLAETSPVSITYDVTNSHAIESDDATDDLACLDDDNDNMRTQDIEVLPAGDASLNTASVSTCTNSAPLNLSMYVDGTVGGTWTATGGNLNGNNFSAATEGTYTLTYTVGGGDCANAASLTVTVGAAGNVDVSGLPNSVCEGTAVVLSNSATWSGDGVSGNTFSAGPGTYVITGTAGSGDCADTESKTITVVAATSVEVSQSCNGSDAVVTLTISGGVAPYTVNGAAIAGNSASYTLTSGSFFSYSIDDASACGAVSALGTATTCEEPCTAEAGSIALLSGVQGGKTCANVTIQVTGFGFNADANHTYVMTDASGQIVAASTNGIFADVTNEGGEYQIWGVNFCDGTTLPINANDIVLGQNLDVTEPINITIAPEIEVSLQAICDVSLGGYVVQMTISGGDPSLNGLGSYLTNCSGSIISGSLSTLTGDPVVIILGNGDANTPFPAGASFSCSAGDGSLCEAAASITFPTEACGIAANPDNGNTLADQPVIIPVLSNDTGDLTVVAVTNPAHGTATINPDGTVTYTPDPGFTGTDVFVYQAVDQLGQPVTQTVTVVVQGSSVAALSADFTRDCSDVATTSQYGVTVFINGGVAPYSIAGTYNEVAINDGTAQFSVPDGSGFEVVVTDAAGTNFTINQSDIIPCSKVDAELVFAGEVKSEGNLLKITTFSEVNNDYFTLEYSRDGINFATIAIIDGAGNSTTTKNYAHTHKNVPNGIGYYRVSTTDFDGNTVIKANLTLTRGEVKFGIVNVYPVPAVNTLTVSFENAVANNVKASIYSVTGQLLSVKDVAVGGNNTVSFNVASYPAGSYYISLNDGKNVSTMKFVKQ